jgi:hypothetical protein
LPQLRLFSSYRELFSIRNIRVSTAWLTAWQTVSCPFVDSLPAPLKPAGQLSRSESASTDQNLTGLDCVSGFEMDGPHQPEISVVISSTPGQGAYGPQLGARLNGCRIVETVAGGIFCDTMDFLIICILKI